LILYGDLTARYAAGSYSKLDSDGKAIRLREERQGAADHGHRITAAVACHVARAGGTVDQLRQLVMHPDHEGGRHVQNIALRSGHARARTYLHRVWASACETVSSTTSVDSRQCAHEDLARLRDRIESTPWRGERHRTALRVLRAHLTFALRAGGRQHAASERQVAEEAGIARQTLRNVYEAVLKPLGWLRRLRIGRGKEGSTWYLGNGPDAHDNPNTPSSSRTWTTQCPPEQALEEWPTHETGLTANIDSTVISHLMVHDAFAHHGLGSPALMVIGALHLKPGQTVRDITVTASLSRATAYRALNRLAAHGLAHRTGETWTLAPRALEGVGNSLPEAVTEVEEPPARGWEQVARRCGTAGIAAARKALHAAEREEYREALERKAEHRSQAQVVIRDGRQVLIPALHPGEIHPRWQGPNGQVRDPATGRADPEWRLATDGRLILITQRDQRTYDETAAAYAETVREGVSAP
jgi:hypothetical protein